MQYRSFGRLAWQPSALGFGAMRLPLTDGEATHVDFEQSVAIIRQAIEGGINYVDTAYTYHGGQSEVAVGMALADGYRARVHLADKMPPWVINSPEDMDRVFDQQLERLQTDHVDHYLLHSLNAVAWQKMHGFGILQWLDRQLASGRIRTAGFSFHDQLSVFKEIIGAYDKWSFCQIYYNYTSADRQAGIAGLHYANERGLGVVVMGPLQGGLLSKMPPPPVAEVFARSPRGWSPSEWGLQWVWNQPEVSLALSGMTTAAQVEENLASANRSGANSLSQDEVTLMAEAAQRYLELRPIPCTECRYCQPCPNGVNIPEIFRLYNLASMFDAPEGSRRSYQLFMAEKERADKCLQCGDCETICPQNIAIIEWLQRVEPFLSAQMAK
jgi:uncharacterized protein